MSQYTIPCAVYRGGTSRGLFFHERDLPSSFREQSHIFLNGIDAYNPSQVDGLGSGTSHTSKVVVIGASDIEGVDVNYTFYQIGIGKEIVDGKGTCGNLMAAAGAFAVDEGYVEIPEDKMEVKVTIYNTNINRILNITVPIKKRKARVSGNYAMPGLVRPGAKYKVRIMNPGGGKTGKTLPIGRRIVIETKQNAYEATFIDVVNPLIYVSSKDLGLLGTELNEELTERKELLEELEEIRCHGAVAAGMVGSIEEAKSTQAIPKIALVSEPQDYKTSIGKQIKKYEVDVVAKMLSMGKFHRTFAGSGLYNLAAAVKISDTVPNVNSTVSREKNTIRIGHPEGIVEVQVALSEDGEEVQYVGLERTARRIIKGDLYVPTFKGGE